MAIREERKNPALIVSFEEERLERAVYVGLSEWGRDYAYPRIVLFPVKNMLGIQADYFLEF